MLKDVQVFILKIIESTFPKHTHTYLVPGNLVSGNMLYNFSNLRLLFSFENICQKKNKKKTKEHMSIVPQQKELVFFS